jgi:hypothetical protein
MLSNSDSAAERSSAGRAGRVEIGILLAVLALTAAQALEATTTNSPTP